MHTQQRHETPTYYKCQYLEITFQPTKSDFKRDDRPGRRAQKVLLRKSDLYTRLSLSIVVNYVIQQVLVTSLPIMLCTSETYMDFVLNAAATIFIIELDDTDGDDLSIVQPGKQQMFTHNFTAHAKRECTLLEAKISRAIRGATFDRMIRRAKSQKSETFADAKDKWRALRAHIDGLDPSLWSIQEQRDKALVDFETKRKEVDDLLEGRTRSNKTKWGNRMMLLKMGGKKSGGDNVEQDEAVDALEAGTSQKANTTMLGQPAELLRHNTGSQMSGRL